MKFIFLILLGLFTARAGAETHGGVLHNNAQMVAVASWASEEGGSLDRVLSVLKFGSCDKGDLFRIGFGSMDQAGRESIRHHLAVLVTGEYLGELKVEPVDLKTFKCRNKAEK